MKILVINCGSSSLKYQLIDMEHEAVLCKGICDRIGIGGSQIAYEAHGVKTKTPIEFPTHTEAFMAVVEAMTTGDNKVVEHKDEISAIGHRIVQGAEFFTKSVLVDDAVIAKIDELSPLAPVHNPAHVQGLNCAKAVFGDIPNVVVFDTTFHQTMPQKAYMFGIPYKYYRENGIRRYGAHGTSHRYVSQIAKEHLGNRDDLKIVTCHLGNGSSISAVKNGECIDTSMGFTPLGGLIMGTRCGDIDPSVVCYLNKITGKSGDEMSDLLNKESGFLGVSEFSSDKRDLENAVEEGHVQATLASEMFDYQISKFIGGYAAAMNGLDCIVFTGGIGENDGPVRANSCAQLEFLGVKIDAEENKKRGQDFVELSTPDSKVKVFIIATNEELMIARDTKAIVEAL